jgi:hypothetical protein
MVVALENEQREEPDALHRLDPPPADLVPRCRRLQRFFFEASPTMSVRPTVTRRISRQTYPFS